MELRTKDKGLRSKFGKVGVLMGGPSNEREISLKSGKAVYEALKQLGLDAVPIDITTDSINDNIDLIKSFQINCAFIALHGRFGEDGSIQGILDILNIAYTGSGCLASKLAMDKVSSRRVIQLYGLDVPKYKVIDKISYSLNWKLYQELILPAVIKPSTCGSSIGLSIIDEQSALNKAIELAFDFDNEVIIEEYVSGREVTVGILEDEALPVVEIVPKRRFFDYEAKYTAGMTDYIVPARLDAAVAKEIQSVALSVHRLLGCFGYSRIDMILAPDNRIFVLELNSIPGLTPVSLLPRAAGITGVDFTQLCLRVINTAYEKRKSKKAFQKVKHKKVNS